MVGVTVWTLLLIGKKDTEWTIGFSALEKSLIFFVCILSEGILLLKWRNVLGASTGAVFCLCIFWGCLLTACIMDGKEKQVYRFVWMPAYISLIGYITFGLGAARDLLTGTDVLKNSCMGYLIFVLLQQGVFSKLYGKADCYAFSVCGGVWLIKGDTFARCVIHMAVSFVLLTLTQMLRKNVAGTGRLKRPVPMVPYIITGFLICIFLEELSDAVLGSLG